MALLLADENRKLRLAMLLPTLVALAALAMPPALAATDTSKASSKTQTKSKSKSSNSAPEPAFSGGEQSIVALVNDEPITGYEVALRQRLLSASTNIGDRAQSNFKALLQRPTTTDNLKKILNEVIQANKGKTREQIIAIFEERKKQYALSLQKQAVESARSAVLPGLKKTALEELIEERLKLQEAKRLSVIASDDDVEKIIKSIAERNKQSVDQLSAGLRNMGADISTMRSRFKAMLSWNDVVRRKFGHMVAISERDVDRYVASSGAGGDGDQVELEVKRITLPVAGKLDQKVMAGHMKQADSIRARYKGCNSLGAAAASVAGAKLDDLGTRLPSAFPEPTRSLLAAAKDGEMLPPTVGGSGIELWAVCGRSVLKADEAKRTEAEGQLKQKELEMLAKRHLNDLRQDASIEYR